MFTFRKKLYFQVMRSWDGGGNLTWTILDLQSTFKRRVFLVFLTRKIPGEVWKHPGYLVFKECEESGGLEKEGSEGTESPRKFPFPLAMILGLIWEAVRHQGGAFSSKSNMI